MNLVGKIFVVLILILSVVFAAFSMAVFATHTDWRNEIVRTPADVHGGQQPGYKYQLEEQRKKNQRLQDERNKYEAQLAAEKAAKIRALAKAEVETINWGAEATKAKKDLATKDGELETNTKMLDVAQKNLAKLTGEVNDLRGQIAKAQTETGQRINQATQLQDQMTVAEDQLSVLKERNQQLISDLIKARQLQ